MWTAAARTSLLASALLHLYFGAIFAIDPGPLLANLSLDATSPAGVAEMRAFYGGLMLALGALFTAGALRRSWLVPTLVLMTVTYAGAAGVRALSLWVDAVRDALLLQLLAIELCGATIGLACLVGLQQRPGADPPAG